MREYVLGFAFHEAGRATSVALVTKSHPPGQRGRLNGVGGHVHAGEAPAAAMAREFREEAGRDTDPGDWRFAATLQFPAAVVYVFTATLTGPADLTWDGDEPVRWYNAELLPEPARLVEHVAWLVPFCRAAGPYADVVFPA
jgi:8-oxo-dGTP pyrophosphatase MutT (NUDIX family)